MNVVQTLCDDFKNASEYKVKTISVRVLPGVNLQELDKFPYSFCSLGFIYNELDVKNIRNSEPFLTLQKLIVRQRNKHILFHLPCRNFSKKEIFEILKILKECNVKNILVLQGVAGVDNRKGDFEYAVDLVTFIKNECNNFTIGVAAYPDVHPESPNAELDLMRLQEKIKAGSDFVITQMVFNYKTFEKFYKKFEVLCPGIPLLVGMYVISSYESYNCAKRMFEKELPQGITDFVTTHKDDQRAILDFGVNLCRNTVKQVLSPNKAQVVGIHFFMCDNLDLVKRICDSLELQEVHKEEALNMTSCIFFKCKHNVLESCFS